LVRKVPPVSDLDSYEAEMAAAEAEAWARLRVAVSWHQAADRELSALTKPTSGGPVDRWFRAAAAVEDSLQACEAYEAFGDYTR
jgi:hypothetical protein